MGVYTRHKQTNPFFHVRTRFPLSPLQATLEDTDNFHVIKTRSMYLLRTLLADPQTGWENFWGGFLLCVFVFCVLVGYDLAMLNDATRS